MHTLSSTNLGRREVDLSALSASNEARIRKKQDVESKLREAITTLRKPNREMAMLAKSQDDESLSLKGTSVPRPPDRTKKSASTGDGVTILATPSKGRNGKTTPHRRPQGSDMTQITQPSFQGPRSATRIVPASALRGSISLDASSRSPTSTLAIPQTGHRSRTAALPNVQETPSRGFAKFLPLGLVREPGTLEGSLIANASSAALLVQQTPSKPALVAASPNVPRTPHVELKAMQPLRTKALYEWLDLQDSQSVKMKSLYEELGWDDYEELG